MPNQPIDFSQGLVTSRDPSTLKQGELVEAQACEYRIGTPHIYKQLGRVVGSATFGTAVRAIQLAQYDGGTDKLLAVSGTSVYESAVFTTAGISTFTAVSGLTIDGTAIPSFANYLEAWIMVDGVSPNYIREALAVPGGSTGNWRLLGMQAPSSTITATLLAGAAGATFPAADTGTYVSPGLAVDNTAGVGITYTDSYGLIDQANPTRTETWKFTSNNTNSSRILRVIHSGSASPTQGQGLSPQQAATVAAAPAALRGVVLAQILAQIQASAPAIVATQKVEVSSNYDLGGSATWTTISLRTTPYDATISTFSIADGLVLTNKVAIRATTTLSATNDATLWAKGHVWDIELLTSGITAAGTTENNIYYLYTESYTDSNSVEHESNGSATVLVPPFTNQAAVRLTLPTTARNTITDHFNIYRSVDEAGGGYPFMFRIGQVRVSDGLFLDDFTLPLITPGTRIYPTLTLLYPDGSSLQIPINSPPPLSKKVLLFQGTMLYVPINSQRLYYSLPTSVTPIGAEQVPELYYLEFNTPGNDTLITVERANSGRSVIAYFSNYSMLVNYLPQAADPSIFDQRVTEYVSNTRGAAGVHCTAEVTLDSGNTIAVAVDDLGVWATDGVSRILNWSTDLDWTTMMAGVTIANVILVNNAKMRRLELQYLDAAGTTRKELHFFYGRLKDDGTPLITGPHPMGTTKGIRSKHYAMVDTAWVGWSGANNTPGRVFVERLASDDASNGYDASSTIIPFQVKTGDFYMGGLGRAVLCEYAYPKFGAGTKTLTTISSLQGFYATFTRDGASAAISKSKSFSVGTQKKIYWHVYADRHAIQIRDISGDSLPALVGYELELRDAGIGRDV